MGILAEFSSLLPLPSRFFCYPGAQYLSGAVAKMIHGLQELNLARCGITAKGVNKLIDGFTHNTMIPNTLHTLNLSGNNLRNDDLLVSLAL